MEKKRTFFESYDSISESSFYLDDHNRAILMSHSDTLSSTQEDFTRDSLSTTLTNNFSTKVPSTTIEKATVSSQDTLESPSAKHADLKSKRSAGLNEMSEKKYFDVENIRQSNLWPALTALETSLHASDESVSTDDTDTILSKLQESFTYSPGRFTATLMTVIEESLLESDEENGDVSIIGLIDYFKTTVRAGGRLEDESPPGSMRSHVSDAESDSFSLDNSRFLGELKNKSIERWFSLPSESKVLAHGNNVPTDDTSYMDLEKLTISVGSKKISKLTKEYIKTPRIMIVPASPVNTTRQSIDYRRNRTLIKKTRRSPVSPVKKSSGRSEEIVGRRATQTILSPFSNDDDDDYLTAESETDEVSEQSSLSVRTNPNGSGKKKINMSNLRSHHREWVTTYEQLSRRKSKPWNGSSRSGERTRKLSTHTNKLEMRIMKELAKKRQKCFDIVDELRLRHGSDNFKTNINHASSCNPFDISSDFCSLLAACQEYFQCALNAREITRKSTQKKNENRGYAASSKTEKRNSPRGARRSVGKRRRSTNKSPSPRFVGGRAKLASPLRDRGVSPKNTKVTSVDTSSIRPVSQLRRIFSPRFETAGRSESKAQGATKTKLRMAQPNVGGEKKGSVVFLPGHGPSLYRKIVSPVGEYIRGKQPARPLRP